MIVFRLVSELPKSGEDQNRSSGVLPPKPSQNSRSFATRFFGALPAMSAPLIAPIEVPMTQSGSTPPSISAWYTPAW